MLRIKGKRFCDIHPICYALATRKGIIQRHIKNLLSKEKIAYKIDDKKLPNLVASYSSGLIKRGKDIDIRLQENKAHNIKLACSKINGIVIEPGEVFSFWLQVGNTSKRKGYKDGRVLENGIMKPGIGGGLCNLSNTIHRLVLHSPLLVTEFHGHSDALAPDHGVRIPFSSGTSVSYNYIDYRFKNNTNQKVQLLVWCDEERLYGELRSEHEFPLCYELIEENHHFRKEGEKFYRVSQIYKQSRDRATGKVVAKELVLDNHSEVMYDYSQIPIELIRDENEVVNQEAVASI